MQKLDPVEAKETPDQAAGKHTGDILEIITSRKSIRRFKPDPVPDEMIDKILESARWAPTGENYQPWRFIVVRDQETRNKIGDLAKVGSGSRMTAWYCMGHMQERFAAIEDPEKRARVLRFMYSVEVSEFAKTCPVVIAVLGSLQLGSVDVPYDLSAAVENMLLEAVSLGLGGCWVHGPVASSRDAVKFKKILNIPTEMNAYKVIAYVAIGYALEKRKYPRPKLPLEELVFWEEFGKTTRPKKSLDELVYYERFGDKEKK
jgi:nitroreductase